MTTMTPAPDVDRGVALRPVARWVPTVDERGRRRLIMVWSVPDIDEAFPALVRGSV
jgi:hypothetical protein